ncbi:ANTAR domain-containing protein [Rhodococcus opacus]|uniref:ANTAR domain-containing protein n=1 Tax=Rhodococcus opacus TaxID=37919 RepID=UPI0020163040|nr:ANTAR domain-containing protein [Rhodococcus opacus]MDJ0420014.1 ANTAR domain-containing protein [Rhodococcus opacus]WKN61213.1 ANTAR domain-containing protein [Rhodococcus opacus]
MLAFVRIECGEEAVFGAALFLLGLRRGRCGRSCVALDIVTEAFDPFDEQLMRLLTTAASAAISNSRRWHSAVGKVGQLEAALISRAGIDQAKGMLMAVHDIPAEEAFSRLVEISQRTGTELHCVAQTLIASLAEPSP